MSAYVIDSLIRGVVLLAITILIGISGIATGGQVAGGLILLFWFLMEWFYPVLFEASKRGATPGKRAMGLRVVQLNGSPITLGQAVIRNFLRVVDAMPGFFYCFGLASCLATKRFQRIGDLAAGTLVIYHRLPSLTGMMLPPATVPLPLPVGLMAEEIKALGLFRERAGLWSDGRRVEIADQASVLSGTTGREGVARLLAMAHWVQEKRGDA
jgi:uncharacterized RDD family membrane protein YckC